MMPLIGIEMLINKYDIVVQGQHGLEISIDEDLWSSLNEKHTKDEQVKTEIRWTSTKHRLDFEGPLQLHAKAPPPAIPCHLHSHDDPHSPARQSTATKPSMPTAGAPTPLN